MSARGRFPSALLANLLIVFAASWCGPSSAQVAGRISAQSNYLLRGVSLTRDRPVGILDVSYDSASGLYLNGSAFGALPGRGASGLAGLIGDVGYARRLNTLMSIDGGLTRSEYIAVGYDGYSVGYTEFYGGLIFRHLSARIHYSPDYFQPGARTLYGEIEGHTDFVAGLRLRAHLGALGYVEGPRGFPDQRIRYDWLVGASRQFGPVDLHLSVSGGGPEPEYYYQPRPKTEVVVGAGYTF